MNIVNFLSKTGLILAIIFGVILLLIIVAFIIIRKKSKKEPSSSILDVNLNGVDDRQEFNYGYEKEDTQVINPVDGENIVSRFHTSSKLDEEKYDSEKVAVVEPTNNEEIVQEEQSYVETTLSMNQDNESVEESSLNDTIDKEVLPEESTTNETPVEDQKENE